MATARATAEVEVAPSSSSSSSSSSSVVSNEVEGEELLPSSPPSSSIVEVLDVEEVVEVIDVEEVAEVLVVEVVEVLVLEVVKLVVVKLVVVKLVVVKDVVLLVLELLVLPSRVELDAVLDAELLLLLGAPVEVGASGCAVHTLCGTLTTEANSLASAMSPSGTHSPSSPVPPDGSNCAGENRVNVFLLPVQKRFYTPYPENPSPRLASDGVPLQKN